MSSSRRSKHRAYARSKAWALPAAGAAAAVIGQPLLAGSAAQASLVSGPTVSTVSTTTTTVAAAPSQAFSQIAAPATPSAVPTPEVTQTYVQALIQQVPQQSVAASRSQRRQAPVSSVVAPSAAPQSFPVLDSDEDLSDYRTQILYVQKKLGVLKQSATLNTDGAGIYGPQTQAAVQRFQRASGLPTTGVVADLTWKKLSALNGVWSDPGPSTSSVPTVTTAGGVRSVSQRALAIATNIADTADEDGVTYEWAGNGPYQFDCSGFVKYALTKAGYSGYIPRAAAEQYAFTTHISKSQVQPGDLFFQIDSSGYIYHVGFIGAGGKWVEAKSDEQGVGIFTPSTRVTVLYGRIK